MTSLFSKARLEDEVGAGSGRRPGGTEEQGFAGLECIAAINPETESRHVGEGRSVIPGITDAVILSILNSVDGVFKGIRQGAEELEAEWRGDDRHVVGVPEGEDGSNQQARLEGVGRGG